MTTDETTNREMADLAMSRSRVYGFLGALYNRMPDEQFAASLPSQEVMAFLSSLGEAEDAPEDMCEGVRLMQVFIHASTTKSIEELKTELAVERTRLLRGIKPDYSPPPPYESVYVGLEQQPQTLAPPARAGVYASVSVQQAYAEAGVGLPKEVKDQPDFIGFELDFMRHLSEQESEAWTERDRGRAAELLEKEFNFLKGHKLHWVPRFCDVMFQQATLDFYRGVARITKGFVHDDVETLGALVKETLLLQTA